MDAGLRTPPLHRWLDTASATVLLGMTVWAPWAFGCMMPWSEWVLCGAGYLLGVLLLLKHLARLRAGFMPARWITPTPAGCWAVRSLAVLTLVGLEYLGVSWFNSRASLSFGHRGVDLLYGSRLPASWLPTTYDAQGTLHSLVLMGALACTFWATRDWLLGRSRHERHAPENVVFPPARLRRLLWTLCLSSTLLALVSIIQRLDGTDRLIWLIRTAVPWQIYPAVTNPATMSWGTFPARAAGVSYFNMVWPVTLGFWWSLHLAALRRSGAAHRIGGDASVLLLPATLLMAACPWVAAGRMGILVFLVELMAGLALFAALRRPRGPVKRSLAVPALTILLVLAGIFAGGPLQRRFDSQFEDALGHRIEVERVVNRMAADAGWLGLGGGSFSGLSALYRTHADDRWIAFAHNDWMQLRINLGRFGVALGLTLLAVTGTVWQTGKGLRAPREFTLLVSLSLGSLLIQAMFEFPFQVPAIAFLFLLLTAVLLSTPGPRTLSDAS